MNYLRVRGEYHVFGHGLGGVQGTTSAYAENTLLQTSSPTLKRNYLRVRGEYPLLYGHDFHDPELPPRTRRILLAGLGEQHRGGTTSAYAENTEGFS